MRILAIALAAFAAIILLAIAGMIAFSAPAPIRPMAAVSDPFKTVDYSDLPAVEKYRARDGAELAFRTYQGNPYQIVVLIHGSSSSSTAVHVLAKALQAAGKTVYALDMRGHGDSGPHGDIDYIGQLDDDLADFVASLGPRVAGQKRVLIGHSAGGAFTIRFAGGQYGDKFDQYVLLAPALSNTGPTLRPNGGGWVSVAIPRIIGLHLLGGLDIHLFDGLPVIRFALAPELWDRLTPTYSYRLAANFLSDENYAQDLRNTRAPISLLVGEKDESFLADQFAPLLQPIKPDMKITVLPGLGHVDMVLNPIAIKAVIAEVTPATP